MPLTVLRQRPPSKLPPAIADVLDNRSEETIIMIRSRFAHLTTLGLLLAAALAVAACDHTVRGVGQDVEDSGEAVEDAVE